MATRNFPLIFLIISLTLATFPQKPLGDTPYVCPYPCLPPPIGGSLPNPPSVPTLPPPSTSTVNCPPPPSPPPSSPTYYESPPPPAPPQQYYYSPPPPPSSGYVPTYYYYPPPGRSGLFPYGIAPPPPNPILPYFPFYFKTPPPPSGESSATSLTMVNQLRFKSSWLWLVLLSSSVLAGLT
uniref:Extensin domain-containing protein n=1 Tax=Opuntia streptacantha TaxID=393608 RepID=A0A7C9DZM7_OPUST